MSEKRGGITIGIIGTGRTAVDMMTGGQARDSSAAAAADPISAPPDISGPHGRAWVYDLPAMRKRHNVAEADDAIVAAWMIEAPWAHPCWHSYQLLLVHLRGLPGKPAPMIHLHGATHELWLIALNPEKPREPLLTGLTLGAWLHPLNFAAQIIEICDALAVERGVAAVREIVDGKLSPDTDHRQAWVQRFGDNMLKR